MNFMEAVKAMEEGKKVYRGGNLFHYIKGGTICYSSKETDKEENNITVHDVESTDWKIYKEEDNWNLATCDVYITPTNLKHWRSIEDIKTFIQKVKEDMVLAKLYGMDSIDFKVKIAKIIDKRAGEL